jgi:hypothetical protein
MLGSKYGIGSTSDPAVRAAFRRMMKRPGQNPEIVRAILSGVLWRLRRDRLEVRRDVISLLDDVVGPLAILPLFVRHLAANNRRRTSVALLHERSRTSARGQSGESPLNNPKSLIRK